LLLREHHAIQGVIQSVEYQWRCIWGWEEKYLTGEYLELFKKWMSEGRKVAHAAKGEEEKILIVEKQRSWSAQLTEEEKILWSENQKAGHARMTEEEKALTAEKRRVNALAQHAQLTEEEKTLRSEKQRSSALAYHARRREQEAQELLARWKEGVVRW
jgi:hypothetical protein